jgi:hypothetical protein
MTDTEMAKMFGILVDDRYKERRWMKLLQMMVRDISMKMWMAS